MKKRLQVNRIPAAVMVQLRTAATMAEDPTTGELKPASQVRTAQLLGVARRTVQAWELGEGVKGGAKMHDAYALVGLAFRMGGELRGFRCLEILAELEHVEAVRVAAARERSRIRSARYRRERRRRVG